MASVWTAIPDSDIDPDSPFTTALATAYRENVIAAFEKASGAPVLANNYVVEAMMGTASVKEDSISKVIGSDGTQVISTGSTWTPTAGFYNWAHYTGSGKIALELYRSGAWVTMNGGETSYSGFFWADGTNMRLKETDNISSATIVWQKLG